VTGSYSTWATTPLLREMFTPQGPCRAISARYGAFCARIGCKSGSFQPGRPVIAVTGPGALQRERRERRNPTEPYAQKSASQQARRVPPARLAAYSLYGGKIIRHDLHALSIYEGREATPNCHFACIMAWMITSESPALCSSTRSSNSR
jgi:hypothetical protein